MKNKIDISKLTSFKPATISDLAAHKTPKRKRSQSYKVRRAIRRANKLYRTIKAWMGKSADEKEADYPNLTASKLTRRENHLLNFLEANQVTNVSDLIKEYMRLRKL